MVSTAVLELGGSDINDTLSCTVRNQMYETEQILTGITETHTTADSGFVIGSGTGHVESNHTLILVPGVDHTVDFLVSGIYRVACQAAVSSKPVMLQKPHLPVHRSGILPAFLWHGSC